VTLTLFDGKLVARANAFEVDLVNATGGGFGGTFSNPTVLYNNVMDALLAAGVITQAEADAREITTNQAIKNQRLEGYEFNLTGQVTRNWQITANYSYTDGFDSEIGPEVKAWAETAIPFYLQWPDVETAVAGGASGFMTVGERVALWQTNANTEFLREGVTLLGNRKHKANFFTRYTFNEGVLKGLFIGGGYRYQSKMPTNFLGEDLQYNKSRGEADLLMGFRLPQMRFLPHGARVQLNIRNLFDDTEPHLTRYASLGVPARAALVDPRTWRITTSFEF
jgi:outer membrane receptor for ferric coprogen and ferric-rhodotorulic acid